MPLKITPADSAFSDCIRARAKWRCEICGTQYHPPTAGLQCSHFFGRDYWAVRFDPDNALAACAHCHFRLGSDPDYHRAIFEKRLGDRYDSLRARAYDSDLAKEYRHTKGKGEIARYYREIEAAFASGGPPLFRSFIQSSPS